jgi:ribonuclease VapC
LGTIIFFDTSVVVSILASEPDREIHRASVERATRRLTSPVVRLETSIVLATRAGISPSQADRSFSAFIDETSAEEVPIDGAIGRLAVECFERFGKGRHPARLNFADCLSYACAKAHGAALLYKGDDFAKVGDVDFSRTR